MRNVVKGTLGFLLVFFISASLTLAQTGGPMQQGMQGMPCCMMGQGGPWMGLMMTIGVLTALLLVSATAACLALTVFLWRRSGGRRQP